MIVIDLGKLGALAQGRHDRTPGFAGTCDSLREPQEAYGTQVQKSELTCSGTDSSHPSVTERQQPVMGRVSKGVCRYLSHS